VAEAAGRAALDPVGSFEAAVLLPRPLERDRDVREIDRDTAIKQINDKWEEKTDELGRDTQLAAYKASLGVQK